MAASRPVEIGKLEPALQLGEGGNSSTVEIEEDDVAWATRSNMWQNRLEKASIRRTKRAKPAPALTLSAAVKTRVFLARAA